MLPRGSDWLSNKHNNFQSRYRSACMTQRSWHCQHSCIAFLDHCGIDNLDLQWQSSRNEIRNVQTNVLRCQYSSQLRLSYLRSHRCNNWLQCICHRFQRRDSALACKRRQMSYRSRPQLLSDRCCLCWRSQHRNGSGISRICNVFAHLYIGSSDRFSSALGCIIARWFVYPARLLELGSRLIPECLWVRTC